MSKDIEKFLSELKENEARLDKFDRLLRHLTCGGWSEINWDKETIGFTQASDDGRRLMQHLQEQRDALAKKVGDDAAFRCRMAALLEERGREHPGPASEFPPPGDE